MKAFYGSTEAELTSANTSIHSTIVYALGLAIEQHEYDKQVLADLKAVEELLMGSDEMLILTQNKGE